MYLVTVTCTVSVFLFFMSYTQGGTPSSPLVIDSSSEYSSEEGTSPLKLYDNEERTSPLKVIKTQQYR